MKIKVKIDADVRHMLAKRGLEPNGFAQTWFTEECAKQMDPYVPMQTGMLKNRRIVGPDAITYPGPYARYHYYGKLMLAPNGSAWAKTGERKVLTDINMGYHGAPKRGPFWDKRMWFDKKHAILRGLTKIIGGKVK